MVWIILVIITVLMLVAVLLILQSDGKSANIAITNDLVEELRTDERILSKSEATIFLGKLGLSGSDGGQLILTSARLIFMHTYSVRGELPAFLPRPICLFESELRDVDVKDAGRLSITIGKKRQEESFTFRMSFGTPLKIAAAIRQAISEAA
jgi:hypothetical protein